MGDLRKSQMRGECGPTKATGMLLTYLLRLGDDGLHQGDETTEVEEMSLQLPNFAQECCFGWRT